MKVAIKTLILCFISCLISCTSSDKHKVQVLLADTSVTHEEFDAGYLSTRQRNKILNLKDLELGTDSFEIRIYETGMWTPEKLYVIKNENKKWCCMVYYFWQRNPMDTDIHQTVNIPYQEKIKQSILDSAMMYTYTPKCGWKNFADSLNLFNLFSFLSQREIPNFRDGVSDGVSFDIEIGTPDKYKYFSYHCPGFHHDYYHSKVNEFLKFISRQIDYVDICDKK